jgi:hypothetical protein
MTRATTRIAAAFGSATRNIVASALLLSTAAIVALWVRSHHTGDVLALFTGGEGTVQAIGSSDGRIALIVTNIHCGGERAWTGIHASGDLQELLVLLDQNQVHPHPTAGPLAAGATASPLGEGIFGFVAGNTDAGGVADIPGSKMFYVIVPHWSAALALGAAGLWMLLGKPAKRQRRRAKGLCVTCGYDLRESRDRCPECGTPVEPTSPPAAPARSPAPASSRS